MGNFLHVVLVAAIALLVFQATGYGFARLLFPASAEVPLFLAPATGLTYTALIAWWLFSHGYNLGTLTAWLIVVPGVLLSAGLIERDRRHQPRLLKTIGKRWLIFMMVWLPTLGVSVLPLCLRPDSWALSLWNLDIVRHASISRFLQEQSSLSLQGYVAQNPYDFVWFARNTYFGYYSTTATLASLFRGLPHEVISAMLCGVSSLGSTLFFLFARRVFHLTLRASLSWSWLAGTNALALFVLYHGWGGQIFGVCFAMGFLYLVVRTPLVALPERFSARRTAGLGVMLLGLSLSYQHMLPVVLGLALVWRLAETYLTGMSKSNWRPWLAEIVCGLSAGLVLAPQRAGAVLLWTAEAATNKSGWPVRFLLPDYWLGLIGPQMHFTDVGAAPLGLRLATLVGLGLVVTFALLTRRKRRNGALGPLLVALGVVYAFAFALSFLEPGAFFGTYKSFKLLSFFLILPGLLPAVCWHTQHSRIQGEKSWALIALGGYLAAWGLGVSAIVHGDKHTEVLRQTDITALQELSKEASFSSVNIDTGNRWQSMWLTYFFLNQPVFLAKPSYYPISGKLAGEVSFFGANSTAPDLFICNNRKPLRTVIGTTFVDHRDQLFARLGRGWYDGETTMAWMGQTGSDAEIEVYPSRGAQRLTATIHLVPFLSGNEYRLEWNGRSITAFTTETVITAELTELKPGRNILRLYSKLLPRRPDNGDPRVIAFGIKRMEIDAIYK